ncbi:MAG: pyridoxal-dependent decarboxylase [Bacteroidota bacterium]
MSTITPLLRKAYSSERFQEQGQALLAYLGTYLSDLDAHSTNPFAEPQQELQFWEQLLKNEGGQGKAAPLDQVLERTVHVHQPKYMGHQISPPVPTLAFADQLSAVLNAGMGVYEMGRAGSALEQVVINEFCGLLGLSVGAGGFLTHGGTLANLTALLAARASRWPGETEVWETGQTDAIKPCLLVNEQAHYCIDRAVRIMGWGAGGIRKVPSDDQYRIRTDLIEATLAEAKAEGYSPVLLVGSACTTSTGSFDDLQALAKVAEKHQLWLHVDGAHGAPLAMSAQHRHLLAGLEQADSIAMDFHKMCCVPALTTALFFRDVKDSYRTFHQQADYLLNFDTEDEWYNLGRRTFECTKQMLSLRVFSLLFQHGPQFLRDYLNRVCALGQTMADQISSRPDFELAIRPDCNIICFRYTPKLPQMTAPQLDHLNQLIREQIVQEAEFYLVNTRLRGRYYLRCTLSNAFTEDHHISALLDKVASIGNTMQSLNTSLGRLR